MNELLMELCTRNQYQKTIKLLKHFQSKSTLRRLEEFRKFQKFRKQKFEGKLSFEVSLKLENFTHSNQLIR